MLRRSIGHSLSSTIMCCNVALRLGGDMHWGYYDMWKFVTMVNMGDGP